MNYFYFNYEDYRIKIVDMQAKFVYPENNKEYCEIFDTSQYQQRRKQYYYINDKEDVISKPDVRETA